MRKKIFESFNFQQNKKKKVQQKIQTKNELATRTKSAKKVQKSVQHRYIDVIL